MHYAMNMRIRHPILTSQSTEGLPPRRVPCPDDKNLKLGELCFGVVLAIRNLIRLDRFRGMTFSTENLAFCQLRFSSILRPRPHPVCHLGLCVDMIDLQIFGRTALDARSVLRQPLESTALHPLILV